VFEGTRFRVNLRSPTSQIESQSSCCLFEIKYLRLIFSIWQHLANKAVLKVNEPRAAQDSPDVAIASLQRCVSCHLPYSFPHSLGSSLFNDIYAVISQYGRLPKDQRSTATDEMRTAIGSFNVRLDNLYVRNVRRHTSQLTCLSSGSKCDAVGQCRVFPAPAVLFAVTARPGFTDGGRPP
jgi:hypothetical protein